MSALASVLAFLLCLAPAAPLEACTCITVGRLASADGSVMTSHTCDSHRTGSDVHVVPGRRHPAGATTLLTRRKKDDTGPMERYGRVPLGPIPQAAETFGYLAPAYACMNEHQVAIGESTFTGREELVSEKGLIDCETLTRLMLGRARTAREAIRIAGELLAAHGWSDVGEALTVTDPKEAWHLEIIGPGKERVGAVWAAQRIPDDHVSVVANASRIRRIDPDDPDRFMASDNVVSFAVEQGYWKPDSGRPFEFCYAYNPTGRTSFSCSRREWRVFDLLAPGLKLDPNSNNFPFSVEPEEPVTPKRIMELFRDTFEGTDFDVVKNLNVADEEGKVTKSPLANPFMPYDMNRLLKTNGGWGWRGERCLARWYCMYVHVTQSRERLPGPIGGLVWFGYGNPAMTTFVPIYAGVTDLPEDYKTDGRATGFSRDSAWWAFNRAATLAAHRWGDMRNDVAAVRDPLLDGFFTEQERVEAEALSLFKEDPDAALEFLTDYTGRCCARTVEAYWALGDLLWTEYDEKW